MTGEAILLVGRAGGDAPDVFETHAERLRRRTDAAVHVATYESEPVRELRDDLAGLDADRTYAVPMRVAHTHETVGDVPAALSYVPGSVQYCEPVGQSPAVTDAIARRAAERVQPAGDASLILVGFGSSSKPYQRQTADYHAARLREETDYAAVETCYLLQNPAVECVRYNVSTDRAVAVPLFLASSEATERRIPAKLELDRGGIDYAEPLGTHERVTDAIRAEVAKQRALADAGNAASATFEAGLTASRRPVATDGEGR